MTASEPFDYEGRVARLAGARDLVLDPNNPLHQAVQAQLDQDRTEVTTRATRAAGVFAAEMLIGVLAGDETAIRFAHAVDAGTSLRALGGNPATRPATGNSPRTLPVMDSTGRNRVSNRTVSIANPAELERQGYEVRYNNTGDVTLVIDPDVHPTPAAPTAPAPASSRRWTPFGS